MINTITGVVVNGVVVPSIPLPEGKTVEIHMTPDATGKTASLPRLPELILGEAIAAPHDLPRSSQPMAMSVTDGESNYPSSFKAVAAPLTQTD